MKQFILENKKKEFEELASNDNWAELETEDYLDTSIEAWYRSRILGVSASMCLAYADKAMIAFLDECAIDYFNK